MLFKSPLFKEAKKIALTPREKLLIHDDLKAFMRAHPVSARDEARHTEQKTFSHFLSSFTSTILKPFPLTLSALLLLGGGTAFAAERALPTDALYPIKIQVNERLRATLTPTSEGKAKWATQVAERRLEEAEKLALDKKLAAQTQIQIETNFDEQAKIVQEKIDLLKTEGNIKAALELSNNFQTFLRAHETILTRLNAQNENSAAFEPLLEKVKSNVTTVSAGIKDLETTSSADTQVNIKMEAQQKQAEASDSIAVVKQRLTESTALNAEIKTKIATLLESTLEQFNAGNASYNSADYKPAASSYDRVMVNTNEIRILIKSSEELHLDTLPPLPAIDAKGIDIKGTFTETSIPPVQLDSAIKTEVKMDAETQTNTLPPDSIKKDSAPSPESNTVLEANTKTDPLVPPVTAPDKTKVDPGF